MATGLLHSLQQLHLLLLGSGDAAINKSLVSNQTIRLAHAAVSSQALKKKSILNLKMLPFISEKQSLKSEHRRLYICDAEQMCTRAVPTSGQRGNLFWFEELWEVVARVKVGAWIPAQGLRTQPRRSSGRREAWRLERK